MSDASDLEIIIANLEIATERDWKFGGALKAARDMKRNLTEGGIKMPAWDTTQKIELERQLSEMRALAESRVIKTEEGRSFVNAGVRLLETLIDGKPSTPLLMRHNP